MSVPENTPDPWTNRVATWPVAFAQVREDPRLDLGLVKRLSAGGSMVMIASGGDTAAVLCGSSLGQLHLVDFNPAQLALTRLKLFLRQKAGPEERLQLLGHRSLEPGERKARLVEAFDGLELKADCLGPLDWVSEVGPDRAGRYEAVFAEVVSELQPEAEAIRSLLALADASAQSRRMELGTPLGHAVSAAFDKVMRLPNLVRLFGDEETRNPSRSFASHFAERLGDVLGRMPARSNPFLWQVLAGRFPDQYPYDWLASGDISSPGPELVFQLGPMQEVLDGLKADSVDLVHLSNILDGLSPETAAATLQSACRVLKRGGVTIVRQLNSSLNIPAVPSGFKWARSVGERLLAMDRSFFYRAIHLGRKP